MAAAGVAATPHVLRSTLRADQIITYDAAKAPSPAAQAVSVRYFVCMPCSGSNDRCIRVRDAFYGRGGKAPRLYSCCAKQLQNEAALDAAASTKKREETAAANERGTPLHDLVRTPDEQLRVRDAICRSDVIRGLSKYATVHLFATGRPLFDDNFSTVLDHVWDEALRSFYIDTPVLRQLVSGDDAACISSACSRPSSRSSCSRWATASRCRRALPRTLAWRA